MIGIPSYQRHKLLQSNNLIFFEYRVKQSHIRFCLVKHIEYCNNMFNIRS